jgi:hypothetical protein
VVAFNKLDSILKEEGRRHIGLCECHVSSHVSIHSDGRPISRDIPADDQGRSPPRRTDRSARIHVRGKHRIRPHESKHVSQP